MKSWKVIAGGLLVFGGFCAGVGLNLFPIETVVHGAPGDPQPALKSVTHDTTLTGDGTQRAPLGVANPNGGGIRVVDSIGQPVGPLVGSSSALRKVVNFTFAIQVVPSGFPDNGAFLYSYTSHDCSGTQYLQLGRTELITPSRQSGTVLEYVTGPFERVTINSYETSYTGIPRFCIDFPNHDTNIYGRGATFDLSTLGLVPPFHLEF